MRRTRIVACTLIASMGVAARATQLHAQRSGDLVLEAPASTEAMAYGNGPRPVLASTSHRP